MAPVTQVSFILILILLSLPPVSPGTLKRRVLGKAAKLESQGNDCSQIWTDNPKSPSGVYVIRPEGTPDAFRAYCDMGEDGGWTVFQRRTGGNGKPLAFDRVWWEYDYGFGDVEGEHWLGLSKLYFLTHQPGTRAQLKLDLHNFENESRHALYDSFQISDKSSFYTLKLGRYSGNAGDSFGGENWRGAASQVGSAFSTLDRDHDSCNPCISGDIAFNECSQQKGGAGWWFSDCGVANLHGDWHPEGDHKIWSSDIHWGTWSPTESLKATEMKVKTVVIAATEA
ncbi:angiopoietin-related protein 5-like [Vombatus ursinus]|uniref:Fibrinogen C-terminal domain-containing protein n=1 Tax=Vombatus ursinus TaxID=29139 RepID=A0A4X2JWJ7_VOMUR|nr:angiopoietin-related protein 5-like [Vombatus ursinus]XP_027710016.1 angiopoietin-related protein 5-like [Vombatus ursinus]XP_027710017.1 angiopoietin-related protein 5-like [Vombatus ursinus]